MGGHGAHAATNDSLGGPTMRTHTRFTRAALAATAIAALTLTACEMPGEDKKADATPAAQTPAPAESPADPANSPAADPTPAGEPTAPSTKRPPAPSATAKSGARVLVEAPTAGGYQRLTGAGAPSDVPVDPGDVTAANKVVVLAYGKTATGPREVLFVGVDGLTSLDGKRMEHLIRGMIDHVNADGGSVPEGAAMKPYSSGLLGGTLECMPAQDAHPAAICAWADKNTAAVAYFDKLSADAAAKKLLEMRTDLEK